MKEFLRTFETRELQDRMIRRCEELLEWVYTVDPESIDISDDYHVPRGERRIPVSIEEQKRYFGYILKNRGRRNPVATLTSQLIQLTPESEEHLVFLITELSEVDLLLRQNHVVPVVIRTASFLQQILEERIDENGDAFDLIVAANGSEMTGTETRLAQFIRLCRNDIGHNFAFDTEYSFEVHDHAAIAGVALLNSLRESWFNYDWYVENRLSAANCVRVVEGVFGFEWEPENDTYGKYSMNEEYDNRPP